MMRGGNWMCELNKDAERFNRVVAISSRSVWTTQRMSRQKVHCVARNERARNMRKQEKRDYPEHHSGEPQFRHAAVLVKHPTNSPARALKRSTSNRRCSGVQLAVTNPASRLTSRNLRHTISSAQIALLGSAQVIQSRDERKE